MYKYYAIFWFVCDLLHLCMTQITSHSSMPLLPNLLLLPTFPKDANNLYLIIKIIKKE